MWCPKTDTVKYPHLIKIVKRQGETDRVERLSPCIFRSPKVSLNTEVGKGRKRARSPLELSLQEHPRWDGKSWKYFMWNIPAWDTISSTDSL